MQLTDAAPVPTMPIPPTAAALTLVSPRTGIVQAAQVLDNASLATERQHIAERLDAPDTNPVSLQTGAHHTALELDTMSEPPTLSFHSTQATAQNPHATRLGHFTNTEAKVNHSQVCLDAAEWAKANRRIWFCQCEKGGGLAPDGSPTLGIAVATTAMSSDWNGGTSGTGTTPSAVTNLARAQWAYRTGGGAPRAIVASAPRAAGLPNLEKEDGFLSSTDAAWSSNMERAALDSPTATSVEEGDRLHSSEEAPYTELLPTPKPAIRSIAPSCKKKVVPVQDAFALIAQSQEHRVHSSRSATPNVSPRPYPVHNVFHSADTRFNTMGWSSAKASPRITARDLQIVESAEMTRSDAMLLAVAEAGEPKSDEYHLDEYSSRHPFPGERFPNSQVLAGDIKSNRTLGNVSKAKMNLTGQSDDIWTLNMRRDDNEPSIWVTLWDNIVCSSDCQNIACRDLWSCDEKEDFRDVDELREGITKVSNVPMFQTRRVGDFPEANRKGLE